MHRKFLVLLLAGVLLSFTACYIDDFGNFGGLGRYSRDFHYEYPLKAGGRLSLESFNGAVEISTWDQNTIDISGTKRGPTEAAADMLNVSIDHTADSVAIRVVRPSERRNNLGARFAIKLPRNVLIDRITTSNGSIRIEDGVGPTRLHTSNGSIRLQSFRGTLDAQTSNGPIDLVECDGDVTAHSSNGHIHAEHLAGALDASTSNNSVTAVLERPDSAVRISTSNGGVELTLPPNYSAAIRANTSNNSVALRFATEPNAHLIASTSNSSITSAFEMRVHGNISRNHTEGDLGSGGPTIDLRTSNGAIRLVRTAR